MRHFNEIVKADVRSRMSLPHRQSVAQISAKVCIDIVTLYIWRYAWGLPREDVTATEKDPDSVNVFDKFMWCWRTLG